MSQASFLILRMPHWIKRKTGRGWGGEEVRGRALINLLQGLWVCDQWTWPAYGCGGGFSPMGGISDVDSGRLLLTACDWRAWSLGWGGGALCPVGQSQTLPVGGGVNNVATGKINCRQAAGLRGALWWGEASMVGKASDLSGPEEISQGRLTFPSPSVALGY